MIIENSLYLHCYGKQNVRILWYKLLSPFFYLAVQCDKLLLDHYPSGMWMAAKLSILKN